MIEDPKSLSVRYASTTIGFKPPHFAEVALVQFCRNGTGILPPDCLPEVFDKFRGSLPERGGPGVLSLNFQGVSGIEPPALEELAEAILGFNVIRTGGRQIFTRAVNVCDPLSGNLSQFLDGKNLVVAAIKEDNTVILTGNKRFVEGFSPTFLKLSQLTGWVRGAIYLHDQFGISSPEARRKLLAMYQLGIVIARGDVDQNGVVHSLV